LRVLVTGATGFTGGHLSRHLAARDYSVRALVRRTAADADPRIEYVNGDIRDPASLERAAAGVDVVYHIAAAYRESLPYAVLEAANVTGTRNVAEACKRYKVKRLVHCSTVGVHGDIKNPPADENAPFSHLDNLARGLDPLAMAHRIQDRVSSVGFDWDDPSGAFAKVREEVEEVAELADAGQRAKLEEEIGDLLFAVVNYARLSGVHADLALRAANEKFGRRFRALEKLAPQRGVKVGEASLEELDRLWDEVKAAEL
jgi:NTP pyrophosphatase (non-canonical NTP hydrolase)